MSKQRDVAEAMARAVGVFTRRPDMGLHDDASARAVWHGGTRITSHHAAGATMDTDMPRELGGSGDCVSPGWLFRAGIAACASTVIAMVAASEGIELAHLEIIVGSRSDTRGVLGMTERDGGDINPGPEAFSMDIHVDAPGVEETRVRALVEEGLRRSPMQNAMLRHAALNVAVNIEPRRAA